MMSHCNDCNDVKTLIITPVILSPKQQLVQLHLILIVPSGVVAHNQILNMIDI